MKTSIYCGVMLLVGLVGLAVCEHTRGGSDEGPEANDFELVSGAISEGDECGQRSTTVLCHSPGPVELDGRGEACVVGERRCVDGQWSACEVVRYVDLDAPSDGVTRAALIGEATGCGGCDPACLVTRDSWWNPMCTESDCSDGIDNDGDGRVDGDFGDERFGVDGLTYDPDAEGLVIGSGGSSTGGRYAWIASHQANVVNKLNMETLTNDGVYRTGQVSNGASDPSRTTVDRRGYVYVANRGYPSVTKIAGDRANCYGDYTSDGISDLRGAIDEGQDADDCIIWDTPIDSGSNPRERGLRGLQIDARGRLWVGDYARAEYWVLDTQTGAIKAGPISTGDHHPYGAAISPDGTLWSADDGGEEEERVQSILPISTLTEVPSESDVGEMIIADSGVYGIAVDDKGRVFVGGGKSVGRYDPTDDSWTVADTPKAFGVAVHLTDSAYCTTGDHCCSGVCQDGGICEPSSSCSDGRMYVAGGPSDVVSEHDTETMELLRSWDVVNAPRGCAPDFSNRIWAANQQSSDCAVIDLETDEVEYISTYGNNYTYSDFTGYGFATFTNPEGSFTRRFDSVPACGTDGSERYTLYYDAEVPDTTRIVFYAKTADESETGPTFTFAREVLLGEVDADNDPGYFDLQDAFGDAGLDPSLRYMLIRVVLQRNGSASSPVFHSLALEEYCE